MKRVDGPVVVLLAAFVVVVVVFTALAMFPEPPPQPVEFSHGLHREYWASGEHAREKAAMHGEILGEELPEVAEGLCVDCHGDLAEAAEESPGIRPCSGCHGLFSRLPEGFPRERRICLGCHRGVVDGELARLPGVAVCGACHEGSGGAGEAGDAVAGVLRGLREREAARGSIWRRVDDSLPPDVVFSHRRHVLAGGLDCEGCHPGVSRAAGRLWRAAPRSMGRCIDCHEERGVTTDCLACHK
jgi:hypothetical protein